MGFQAQSANLVNPTTANQVTDQYGNLINSQQAQQNFLNATQAQNGLGNQSSVFNQMQGVANGTGPNPAQAQLAQATGANVANQNAMMAGQRGAGANVGMMARQAAQQGANTQQQAAGQAASLQAQQSLGALGQMGGIANQQAAQQGQAVQNVAQGAQTGYGQTSQNIAGQNQAAIGNVSQQNQSNAAIQGEVAKQQGALVGNLMGGAGAVLGLAEGGNVSNGPRSGYGKMFATGGKVPALVSPGEKYLTPQQASQVVDGKANPMTTGKTIPGTPKVGGAKNSYANDTVPATLQEGGIVIPRSVTQAKDAESKAQAFVKAHFAQRNKK